MFKSLILQLIAVIIVISSLEVLGQRPKKCADTDEYCQIHSDCCSNSCLTYLYRCTKNYNGVYPYTFFGEKKPPTGTLEDVIAFTLSNYGSFDEMKRHQSTQQTIQEQRPYGFSTGFSYTEISGGDKHLNEETSVTEQTTTSSKTNEITKNTTSEGPEQQTENHNNNNNNNNNNSEAVETRISATTAECYQIGSKCYKNEECCSKRCHGFLHQCVT